MARYATATGITDSSLPANYEEIVALRELLTGIENQAQKKILGNNNDNPDSPLSVTEAHVPVRDGYKVRCVCYKPAGNGPFPLYVYMHGGGWVVGKPETDDGSNRELCMRNKIVIFSVDYRLAPEHPFPTPVTDCENALLWAYKNAHQFNCDVSQGVILGGFSAGGQLSTTLAIKSRLGEIPVPVYGLLIRSPWLSDWRALTPELTAALCSIEENKDTPFVTSDRLHLMLEWFAVPADQRTDPRIFPLHLDSTTAAKMPPTFIQVSGADPLRDEGIALYDILQKAGVASQLRRYDGMPHGFHTHNIPTGVAAESDMQTGIRWILDMANRSK